MRFDEIFVDDTKNVSRINSKEFKYKGKIAIVDQGKNLIAGYTDFEYPKVCYEERIIFGDHTRIFKYVNLPFVCGADGTKVLKLINKDRISYKYMYYYLLSSFIPNTGYNRHFKWVKELTFNIPKYEIQLDIVKRIDKVNNLIELRKKEIENCDNLIKSQFVEMFDNDNLSSYKWTDVFNTTTGKLDSNAMVTGGKYPFFTCAKESFWINEYAFDCEALLLAGNNAAGIYDVKHYKGKFNAYQRTYVLTLKNDKWRYELFKLQLEEKLELLRHQSKGTNTRYLTMTILNDLDFKIPPIEEQNKFAEFVQKVNKQKSEFEESLKKLEELQSALMQEYFG